MLNKKGQRELAYAVKVEEIKPLEGYDRVEYARIGSGWWCVVKKDDFKVGDTAVYFEIDSKLPEKPEFEFCAKYKYRVKTQKLCKVLSQGLLMHPRDLNLKEINEGDFLTEKLGVTYYEAEDNTRKADISKYTSMKARHQKFFKTKLGKWLMKREWGRKLCFAFLGKKKDKKTDWPNWVVKTDEERCLVADTKIDTNIGRMRIGDIVNKHLDCQVLSYNINTNQNEYKKIVSYQEYSQPSIMCEIKFVNPYRRMRANTLICTTDHKIYTGDGVYKEASNLSVGDTIYTNSTQYLDEAYQAIAGMLLGDSHISIDRRWHYRNCRVAFTQGECQIDYLKYKLYLLGADGVKLTKSKSGYCNNIVYKASLPIHPDVHAFVSNTCVIKGKKQITKRWSDILTPISFAFWYMDDGRLRNRNLGVDADITLSTCSFTEEENVLLVEALSRWGINSKIIYPKGKNKYFYIKLNTINTDKFLKLISPYMCPSMSYKTLPKYEGLVGTYFKDKQLTYDTIGKMIIKSFRKIRGKVRGKTYDIEVEDNHNFYANGILTHNCQNIFNQMKALGDIWWIATEKIDGSSTTLTMKQNKPKKRNLLVCSRNVVYDKPEKEERNFYKDTDGNIYLEMSEKYHIEELCNKILNDHKDWEFITIQGETYGGKIQQRDYGKEHRCAIFNIIYKKDGEAPVRLNPLEMHKFLLEYEEFELEGVPIVDMIKLPNTCEELLEYAGSEKSRIDGGMREGIVLRSLDGKWSFKAVDNNYLLKYHN